MVVAVPRWEPETVNMHIAWEPETEGGSSGDKKLRSFTTP
jgi:hypothetical protein